MQHARAIIIRFSNYAFARISSVVLPTVKSKWRTCLCFLSEATYACEKRKPILVLRLERDCEPNGWLGIIATGRLYIDFSKLENYDKNCDELLERIQEIKGGGTTENREQNNDNAGVGSNVEGTGQLEKDQGQVVSPRPNPAGNGKARRQVGEKALTHSKQNTPFELSHTCTHTHTHTHTPTHTHTHTPTHTHTHTVMQNNSICAMHSVKNAT